MMYFKNNWNAGPFFFYFMDILEEKKHIYIYTYIRLSEWCCSVSMETKFVIYADIQG
jgi:hypothetical protein